MEALIASQLEPTQFGAYMATGSKKGSAEQILFIQLDGGFGDYFDWKYAEEKCVPHDYGDPKHSVYLGVYRVLEHIPQDALGSAFLTTRDGRTLILEKETYKNLANQSRGFYVYQELCPVSPVIVSALDPLGFGTFMTDSSNKLYMPKIIFTDLKVIDFDNPQKTGNIGSIYDKKAAHLMECIAEVTSDDEKINKTLTRTHVESFAFQTIDHGLYYASHDGMCAYIMPTAEQIKQIDYDWGRSANIL